jgi:spore cortex biosynthesis protein YabQ
VSLDVQFLTLAMMVVSGIGMGVAFDGYRVVSNELRIGRLWIPVLDLLYWAAATLIVFRVLIASNEGDVRMFVFIGLFIGISFYFWLLSNPVIRIVQWLVEAVRWLIGAAIRTFQVLIVKPILAIIRLARVFLGFAVVFSMFLIRIVIQLLRPFWLLLSWMLRPLARPVWARMKGWAERLGLKERWTRTRSLIIRIWRRWF